MYRISAVLSATVLSVAVALSAMPASAQIGPWHQYKFNNTKPRHDHGHRGHHRHDGHHHHHGHRGYRTNYNYFFGAPYGYRSYSYYGSYYPGLAYGYYPRYYPRTYYTLPPVVVPSETWFGPQAVRRFFGMDNLVPRVAARVDAVVVPGGGLIDPQPPAGALDADLVQPEVELGEPDLILGDAGPAVDQAAADAPPAREANAKALARALQFIDFGDQWFGQQRYHEALQRYKRAADAAPDLADAFFRQGFAYAALGMNDRAAFAFQRGAALNPKWLESDFEVDQIYGRNETAKRAHRETVATAAAAKADDADAVFVLGVLLHFDGQAERAQVFFRRAAQLADKAELVEPFLGAAPEQGRAF